MPKVSDHIMNLARRGATYRYQEIQEELRALVRAFPHLGGQIHKEPTKRRHMSAASRKALSERMKKYWAAKRKKD